MYRQDLEVEKLGVGWVGVGVGVRNFKTSRDRQPEPNKVRCPLG